MSTLPIKVSNFLLEICSKKEWNSKVLNPKIIRKWMNEVCFEEKDCLETAIALALSYVQGRYHDPSCEWYNQGDYQCFVCFRQTLEEDLQDEKEEYLSWLQIYKDNDPSFPSQINSAQDFPQEYLEDILDSCTSTEDIRYEKLLYRCEHPNNICKCQTPHYHLQNYIQQVEIKSQLNLETCGFSYHPGSNSIIKDILHPSWSPELRKVAGEEWWHWIPSRFDIEKASFTSNIGGYIGSKNGSSLLKKDSQLASSLGAILIQFIPALKEILEQNFIELPSSFQVIPKIASFELDEIEPFYTGGNWHMEGIPSEHIVATCLYFHQVSNISLPYLEFRKNTFFQEEIMDYPQSDNYYTRHHYGIVTHFEGQHNRYLGALPCAEGKGIVFPNTLQHRIQSFSLLNPSQEGKRTIVVFFVIDPQFVIREVDQMDSSFWIQKGEDSNSIRSLMDQRKYYVDTLTQEVFERQYSLCEH